MGDGTTFLLQDPVVEVVRLPRSTDWYDGDPADPLSSWHRVLADAFPATGGSFRDPNNRWIFYIDADLGCGQQIGGAEGVALVQANELRCFAHLNRIDECTGAIVEPDLVCNCVGGLGHELGHALGLPHPPGCEEDPSAPLCRQALMFLGYRRYPDAILLPADRSVLAAGGFFFPAESTGPLPPCGCGDGVRDESEECDAASADACLDACLPDCRCARRCEEVGFVAQNRNAVLKVKMVLPFDAYASESVSVRLVDEQGSIIDQVIGPLRRVAGKPGRWIYRSPDDDVKKLTLRATRDGARFLMVIRTKKASGASLAYAAMPTRLDVVVGTRCFRAVTLR
jgi:hypothetical protein